MVFGLFKNIRRVLYLILAVIAVYILLKKSKTDIHLFNNNETYIVVRVVDGDTFLLNTKERVRLIGIDTPEKFYSKKLERDAERTNKDKATIQKLGREASDFVKDLVEGKKVTLKTDPYSSEKDRYNRLLRYVYLEDGTLVNAKIIESGYANAYTLFKFEKMDEFRKLESEARNNNRGLWKEGLE
jgi:micrococcal nuclease